MESQASILDDIIGRLSGLPAAELDKLDKELDASVGNLRFIPNPGRQTEAYESKADILLYGGQAGVGKGYLMLGLASQQHKHSMIFRRESTQLDGLERDGKGLFRGIEFNGTDREWTWPDGHTLRLGGMKEADDWNKHAGRERDFMGFDEGAEFLETQVASMLGWLRGPKGQRCRMVLATNPPRSSDGAWVMKWFAPWLDDTFPQPAKHGELRYAFGLGKEKVEWSKSSEPKMIDGVLTHPLSLTFIPARLSDNPFRNTPEYRSRLNSLPEPLRSQLMLGDFKAGTKDDLWQIIPTAWVKAAQARWTPAPPDGVPMCAVGTDPAQGGEDQTVLAMRHDGWYAPLVVVPGEKTPDGPSVAGLVIQNRLDGAKIIIDMGGGYGGSAYDHLKANLPPELLSAFKGAEGTKGRTADGKLGFVSKRMQAYWRFREALDPSQPGGSPIALPVDPVLVSDLTAARFDIGPHGIKFRSDSTKEEITKRLGRSPDRGDAVVMAWTDGGKAGTDGMLWQERRGRGGSVPKVIVGHKEKIGRR